MLFISKWCGDNNNSDQNDVVIMLYEMTLNEYDHFTKQYEDFKNNLFMVILNEDIEEWIKDNIKYDWDLYCEDLYTKDSDDIQVIFDNEDDYYRFRFKFKEIYQYWPEMFKITCADASLDSPNYVKVLKWLEENVGEERLTWNKSSSRLFYFFDEEDAIHFKMVWG